MHLQRPTTPEGDPDYDRMIAALIDQGIEPDRHYRTPDGEALYLLEYGLTDARFHHVPRNSGIGRHDIPIDELWAAQHGDQPLVPVTPRFTTDEEVVVDRSLLDALADWADPDHPRDDIHDELAVIFELLDRPVPH